MTKGLVSKYAANVLISVNNIDKNMKVYVIILF